MVGHIAFLDDNDGIFDSFQLDKILGSISGLALSLSPGDLCESCIRKNVAFCIVDEEQWSTSTMHADVCFAVRDSSWRDATLVLDAEDKESWRENVRRLVFALRGELGVTPERDEYWLSIAQSAARRSSSVSQRVGAVLVKDDAVLALGCNEVPVQGGGLAWSGNGGDSRDFTTVDKNAWSRKDRFILRFLGLLDGNGLLGGRPDSVYRTLMDKDPRMAGLFDFADLGRAVHAEAACICDAARSGGASVDSSVLYSTHEPCYRCRQLLQAAGVSKVVYDVPLYSTRGELLGELLPDLPVERFFGVRWLNIPV